MEKAEFLESFYIHRKTATSEAAMAHLVNGEGLREAARKKKVDQSAVSRMKKEILAISAKTTNVKP